MSGAQDAVDASEHYDNVGQREDIPSLLTIIIDTNPRAWAALNDILPISKAISNILVFVNFHLASSHANQVAIIASHTTKAVWLYPTPPRPAPPPRTFEDVMMQDGVAPTTSVPAERIHSANKYPQFAQIEGSILDSLRALITDTTVDHIANSTTTQLTGALTLALAHINKTSLALTATRGPTADSGSSSAAAKTLQAGGLAGLNARILVVSVSDSSPAQYIPTMNAVFAAAHARIAIDTLSLRGDAAFLQQAGYLTRGTFIRAKDPQGILQYLNFGFTRAMAPISADAAGVTGKAVGGKGPTAIGKTTGSKDAIKNSGGREGVRAVNLLVTPSADVVDFRAACFCHRNVVDTGYVCSICLSIFCEVPEGGECLTCGTKLKLGKYWARPVVSSS
ncbi:transcription factor Tfb4-domain-containing protein [Apodospora peruviana]|uniref:General transcription and DNA repair factor IIH subunit TFB4 n=1 Tax=Apodospora peruviana TaxID=516989 RepID=A0AAE0HYQ5_9PEZI|nr:transcription factor Tfb4-domain-containing protein [Apodospora peruviana]